MRRKDPPEVVYVERGSDASAKWLFWGAALGAGLALLYFWRSKLSVPLVVLGSGVLGALPFS